MAAVFAAQFLSLTRTNWTSKVVMELFRLPNVLNYETSGLVNEPFHVEEPVKSEAVATLAEEEQNAAESSGLSECFSKPVRCHHSE